MDFLISLQDVSLTLTKVKRFEQMSDPLSLIPTLQLLLNKQHVQCKGRLPPKHILDAYYEALFTSKSSHLDYSICMQEMLYKNPSRDKLDSMIDSLTFKFHNSELALHSVWLLCQLSLSKRDAKVHSESFIKDLNTLGTFDDTESTFSAMHLTLSDSIHDYIKLVPLPVVPRSISFHLQDNNNALSLRDIKKDNRKDHAIDSGYNSPSERDSSDKNWHFQMENEKESKVYSWDNLVSIPLHKQNFTFIFQDASRHMIELDSKWIYV